MGMEDHAYFEPLEPRALFSADITLNTSQLIFSGPKNHTTTTQTVTITNTGTTGLKIPSGGLSIVGTDNSKFGFSAKPSLPRIIAPGATLAVKIVFKPTVAGVKVASLKITTNDADSPISNVALRGLAANGLYDSNEPSLQRIFDTLQLPIQAGDADITTNRIDNLAPTDAVDLQTLVKA